MGAAMLPLVDVLGGNRFLAYQAIHAPLAAIANILDQDGGNFTVYSGHVPMIGKPVTGLNRSNRNSGIYLQSDSQVIPSRSPSSDDRPHCRR